MRKILFTILLCGISSSVAAQSTPELNAELDRFRGRIDSLEKTYLKATSLSNKYKIEARFNDASVAFELKDYERASFLFIDVVSSERFKKFPAYRRAHYLLGVSLMEMRNYVAAKRYLEKLVNLGQGDYFSEAGAKLLEIAYKTGEYSSIDKIYANMKTGTMSPALYYLAGKAFYEKKDYSKARENLQRSMKTQGYEKLSNYFIGVSYAAEKNFSEAKSYFEKVVSKSPTTQREIEVSDLGNIALGRVSYETGDLEFAIDYYNRVGRGSRHFDRALWELTWVLVSKKEFVAARTNIDVLVLFENTNPNLLAEAELLRGDLSLRLKEFDVAIADYTQVINKFSPIAEQMNTFAVEHQNVDDFFAALIGDEFAGIEKGLPPLVREWTQNDPKMRSSMQTLRDVKKIEDDISYSFRLLDEMDARLGSSNKIMSVPELAEGLLQGIDAENRILSIQRKLVDKEVEIVGTLTGDKAAAWQTLSAQLDALQVKFEKIPKTRAEITQRDVDRMKNFSKVRKELDDVVFEIKNQQAQIKAVDDYFGNQKGQKISDKEKAEITEFREKMVVLRNENGVKRDALKANLAKIRMKIGAGNDLTKIESTLRDAYRGKLQEAQIFLSQFSATSEMTAIQAAQSSIPVHEKRLKTFYIELDKYADEALVEIRNEVKKQRSLESSYRQSVAQLMTSANGGAGFLAHVNFMSARRQFNETVLKGDVGIIDVVWEKKDDRSTKIGQMFEDRASELKRLQESFDEVR